MTRRRWVALPPQISLRARNSTAGMGACTCGHRDGLLEGFGELEQPATGSKQPRGPLPVKSPDPQVPLRTVCFPLGQARAAPKGDAHPSSMRPTPSPLALLPSLHLVTILIGEGVRPCTPRMLPAFQWQPSLALSPPPLLKRGSERLGMPRESE